MRIVNKLHSELYIRTLLFEADHLCCSLLAAKTGCVVYARITATTAVVRDSIEPWSSTDKFAEMDVDPWIPSKRSKIELLTIDDVWIVGKGD